MWRATTRRTLVATRICLVAAQHLRGQRISRSRDSRAVGQRGAATRRILVTTRVHLAGGAPPLRTHKRYGCKYRSARRDPGRPFARFLFPQAALRARLRALRARVFAVRACAAAAPPVTLWAGLRLAVMSPIVSPQRAPGSRPALPPFPISTGRAAGSTSRAPGAGFCGPGLRRRAPPTRRRGGGVPLSQTCFLRVPPLCGAPRTRKVTLGRGPL